jgi:hypothetical protein
MLLLFGSSLAAWFLWKPSPRPSWKVTRKTREIDCLSCSLSNMPSSTNWRVHCVSVARHHLGSTRSTRSGRRFRDGPIGCIASLGPLAPWPLCTMGADNALGLDRWTAGPGKAIWGLLQVYGLLGGLIALHISSLEDFLRGLTSFSPLNFPMFSCVSCESWIWTAPHFRFFTFLQLHWALQLTGSANLWIRLNGMDAYGISIRRQPSETSLKITEIQTNTHYSTVYICGQPKSLKNIY